MNKYGISTVIPARNEEKFLGKTLDSLFAQDLSINNKIIVVDDGSEDKTSEIARSYDQIELITLANRGYNTHGTPVLAAVINKGLKKLVDEKHLDYIMVLGADHILPSYYISSILEHFENSKNTVICSGQIKGEQSFLPRGSGRIVRYDFWKKQGLQYPLNYGFEAYLVIKALQLGYYVKILDDLYTITSRPTKTSYEKKTYISYGKSLRVLGYSHAYSIGKISLLAIRNPIGAFYMLQGYKSKNIKLYEKDFRDFLKYTQNKKMKSILKLRMLTRKN